VTGGICFAGYADQTALQGPPDQTSDGFQPVDAVLTQPPGQGQARLVRNPEVE
jgi:hypothetical protein